MPNSSLFVTGASGRIGIPLVRRLVDDGHDVVGLARSEEKADQVRAAGARCVIGVLEDIDQVRGALKGVSHVLHLAGGLRGAGPITADILNRQSTEALITAMDGIKSIRRVLFTSTCAVYGDRSGLWVEEDFSPFPNTNYGRSKVAAESALETAASGAKWSLAIVRLAAVYGTGFPWLMADRIAAGKGWLPGEGRNYVPTIHIDDAIEGLTRIVLTRKKKASSCYNLADPEPVLLREFYAAVHGCVGGKPMRFWSTWVPSHVQQRIAHTNERLATRMGTTPRFTNDNLRLFTASVRLNVDRIADELQMEWSHPSAPDGVRSLF